MAATVASTDSASAAPRAAGAHAAPADGNRSRPAARPASGRVALPLPGFKRAGTGRVGARRSWQARVPVRASSGAGAPRGAKQHRCPRSGTCLGLMAQWIARPSCVPHPRPPGLRDRSIDTGSPSPAAEGFTNDFPLGRATALTCALRIRGDIRAGGSAGLSLPATQSSTQVTRPAPPKCGSGRRWARAAPCFAAGQPATTARRPLITVARGAQPAIPAAPPGTTTTRSQGAPSAELPPDGSRGPRGGRVQSLQPAVCAAAECRARCRCGCAQCMHRSAATCDSCTQLAPGVGRQDAGPPWSAARPPARRARPRARPPVAANSARAKIGHRLVRRARLKLLWDARCREVQGLLVTQGGGLARVAA